MAEPNELADDLDAIVRRARGALRGWMWRRAVEKGVAALFPATMLVPLLVLGASLSELLTGRQPWPFGIASSVACAVALPLVAVALACVVAYLRQHASRESALNLYDRHLDCKDRLSIADELVRVDPCGGFERAAVDDALGYAKRALAAAPPVLAWRAPRLRPRRWPLGVVAALALTIGLLLEGKTLAPANVADGAGGAPIAAEALAKAHPVQLPERWEANQTAPAPAVWSQSGAIAEPSTSDPSASAKARPAVFGMPGVQLQQPDVRAAAPGRGSQAGSAAPGASGQSGMEAPRRAGEPNAHQRPRRQNTATPPRAGASSGVAGGAGNSSGSRLASSDQPSSANKAGSEEPLRDVADAAEDEEDETQEAASSRSPMLASRKAPVDRSLTLSGNGEQRDELNGRGGPSGLKKTRGVAAMLLGLPMPDHLGGDPHPGRVQVRRERAEPEEKAVAPAAAGVRGSRDEAYGGIGHIRLPRWARQAVRDFFLAQRGKPHGGSEP